MNKVLQGKLGCELRAHQLFHHNLPVYTLLSCDKCKVAHTISSQPCLSPDNCLWAYRPNLPFIMPPWEAASAKESGLTMTAVIRFEAHSRAAQRSMSCQRSILHRFCRYRGSSPFPEQSVLLLVPKTCLL